MSTPFDKPMSHSRDGTSQTARRQKALEPDYVSVDERSLVDLLAFARDYAKELSYYDENNEQKGDWSAFIDPDMDLEQAAAYAEDPEQSPLDKSHAFMRPHFALFLSFLQLLRRAQDHLNDFTRRHLEFYYQQMLGMTKKAALPDRVNVLLRLTPRVAKTEVPAGHLLAAGRDSLGRDRFYRTDRQVLVNHARIALLSGVFAERQITGIREAREHYKGTRKEAFLNMLRVALGDPLPGDPLREFAPGKVIDNDVLGELEKLINFTQDGLYLELFELRSLMRLKRQRDEADEEWQQINAWLELVGRARSGDAGFRLTPDDPRDFDANLAKALGGEPDFRELSLVENINDLYEQRNGKDEKEFIQDKLFFSRFEDFVAMMQIKVKIDNEWKEINRILQLAGQRKDVKYQAPDAGFDPTDFPTNFTQALGSVDFASVGVTNLDQYYAAFLGLEAYFFMSAEHFAYLMSISVREEQATSDDQKPKASEWAKVYDILAAAYRKKIYALRRAKLKSVREAASNAAQGFKLMLYFTLEEEPEKGAASPLERLEKDIASKSEYAFLESVEKEIQAGASDKINWLEVYRILELTQRKRERLPMPVAYVQKWINLHAHADVTADRVGGDQANTRWKTFGGRPPQPDPLNLPVENFGWAIGSPLLLLSAGVRQVILTLGFSPEGYDKAKIEPLFTKGPIASTEDKGPFRMQISTEAGWISPDTLEIKRGDYPIMSGVKDAANRSLIGLQFILHFSEQVDPIIAPVSEAVGMRCDWPVLRLMLRQHWDAETKQYLTQYAPFEPLQLVNVHLGVQVGQTGAAGPGLGDVRMQNDQTVLDPKKPFHPFGAGPVVGSRFYLGHPELAHKRLDSLSFGIEWMGVPAKLKDHYANYPTSDAEWGFTTQVSLVDKRVAYTLANDAALFDAADATQAHKIEITDVAASLTQANSVYLYRRSLEAPARDDLLNWSRYLQWELTPLDFQHGAYAAVSTRLAIEMAAAIANKKENDTIDANIYQVNPPYTPKIKKLDVHYSASLELRLADYTPKGVEDRIFHIHPFGYHEVQPQPSGEGCSFLPEYAAEGELYIGIDGAKPPQKVSVLFQMAEGSANPDLEPVPVEWSYLSGDQWLSLADGGIQMDSTRGLINTGIIEFELRPTEPSTRLPQGYHWIRAAIAHNSDSVCDTVAIHAQAVSATLIDTQYAADHYARPLPENSITGLSPPIPRIVEVLQPYTSFGGKPMEQDSIFYTRISERLRHKQRALTIWDYERLVLERFPQIYKVKCLPADAAGNPDETGKINIIVIPDVRNRLPFDPFGPKAPADLIANIETFLADKIPPYASVNVRNAHYVPVKVRVGVRFKADYDIGFCKKRLIDDLNRFLSPWAYDEGADIVIGGRIYANSIINFLDGREYVDYIATIKLFSSEDGLTFRLAQPVNDNQGYFVSTERLDGVLVAARRHEIDVIEKGSYEEERFSGINYMKIELDFVVGSDIEQSRVTSRIV